MLPHGGYLVEGLPQERLVPSSAGGKLWSLTRILTIRNTLVWELRQSKATPKSVIVPLAPEGG